MTHASKNSTTPNSTATRSVLWAAIGGTLLLSGACARFLPADPYKNTQTVKVLEVPEGKERPAVDPSLAVPDGETRWVDNGHTPPDVVKPMLELPDALEKTNAEE